MKDDESTEKDKKEKRTDNEDQNEERLNKTAVRFQKGDQDSSKEEYVSTDTKR